MKYLTVVATAPLRKEASDRSEMVSQALFGEHLEVLEKQEKWALVRLQNDGYEGWMDTKQFALLSADWSGTLLTAPITRCSSANGDSIVLPAGAIVPADVKPEIPQPGRTGSDADIMDCAREFLNAPYLWGGRTIMGIDCSGFTQLVMALNGIQLPRDAYQQAELGETVSFLEETQTGDLAFFDNAEGRIIHVGLILRDASQQGLVIHASGKVRIDVIDHQGIFNRDSGQYTHQLRIVKRLKR
jgi:cell wall-associated NlpC family hydrolase